MLSKKLYYRCPNCVEPHWATPFEDSVKVELVHPCVKCGGQINVIFDNILESSLQEDKSPHSCTTCDLLKDISSGRKKCKESGRNITESVQDCKYYKELK